jgi:hypothetical protein
MGAAADAPDLLRQGQAVEKLMLLGDPRWLATRLAGFAD